MTKRLIVLIFAVSLIACVNSQTCKWTNPSNGNVYDLSPLRNDQEDYEIGGGQYSYDLNMCRSVIAGCSVSNCLICQQWPTGVQMCIANLGSQEYGPPTWSGDGLTASYNGTNGRTTIIDFSCLPNGGIGTPTFVSENPLKNYNFVWKTQYACALPTSCQGGSCQSCLLEKGCRWCLDDQMCQPNASNTTCRSRIINPKFCPVPNCHQYGTCDDCLQLNQFCSWCLDTNTCFASTNTTACSDVINDPNYCNLKK